MSRIFLLTFIACFSLFQESFAQQTIGSVSKIDYTKPKDYRIGGIQVIGTEKLDPNALILLSGLKIGKKVTVPGEQISKAIKKLWKQGLFEDVKVRYTKIQGDFIFLEIEVKEQPRLSRFKFSGIKKSEANDLRDEIELYKEKIVTQGLLLNTQKIIRRYFTENGFLNTTVIIEEVVDKEYPDHVYFDIKINKFNKVKVQEIIIEDNKSLTSYRIKKAMKETREKSTVYPFYEFDKMIFQTTQASMPWQDSLHAGKIMWDYATENIHLNIFKNAKFILKNYQDDLELIIEKYKSKGYRDAKIVSDTIIKNNEKTVSIRIKIEEGPQYYFRNIKWVGNTKFPTALLENILAINKGEIYNPEILDQRLYMDPNGKDVSSLYMDDGYLFFQVTPVEVYVDHDSVDLEIRIYEGQQATINKVTVAGNDKTNDHVIYRELRTYPGSLFSRSDIIRSQRELSVLGYFDPQAMNVNPLPDPENGTVDIAYIVAEKPSDQIELSGGFGAGRIVGTAGIVFTNFSLRNLFNLSEWRPLPAGDGQALSLRAQTSGRWFSSINASFTEPWLGGKKPISFSVSGFHSAQTNGEKARIEVDGEKVSNPARRHIKITGASIGLGKQLKWPDDYFVLRHELAFQAYEMQDWQAFIFDNGFANNFFYRVTLNRNSLDQIIYPKLGSDIKVSLQVTPPYSKMNGKDYALLEPQDKYKWIEYYKFKFTVDWYTPIVQNLVFKAKAGYGFLGFFNDDIGAAPFERFYLGGSGLTGFQLDGREIIALRGYDDGSVSPLTGGTSIAKYTAELRYPLSLNPSATIYMLAFAEAGNTWNDFSNFQPFNVNKSAGVGVRIFLPMFGLLGLDWGYRLDDIKSRPGMQQSQIHFTIGANLGQL